MKNTQQTLTALTLAITASLGGFTAAKAAESMEISEKAAAVGMLPYQKRGEVLEKDERNPFAIRVQKKEVNVAQGDGTTEESKIRQQLSVMEVSGISRGANGYTAQVGGLILKEGSMVPALIENQTDMLKVTKVTEKTIEITWVNQEGAEEPRKHVLSPNIRPMIRRSLPGAGGMAAMDPRYPLGGSPGDEEADMLVEGEPPVSPAD